MATITCSGGPHDGRRFEYPEPLPDTVVLAGKQLTYHEYERLKPPRQISRTFAWAKSYRVTRAGERVPVVAA